MPFYDYQCPECDKIFEVRQSFSAEPKAICPFCNYPETRRLISKPAIVFKGSGFYINDSRSDNGKSSSASSKSNDKDATAKSSEGKSDDSKSESKSGESKSSESKSESKSSDSKSDSSKSQSKSKASAEAS